MDTTQLDALKKEAQQYIDRAAKYDITLTFAEFTVFEGGIYLDGMDPGEWIDAMTMD